MLTFETGWDVTLSVSQMAYRLQEDNKISKVTPIQIDLCFHLSCSRITTTQAIVTEESQYDMKNRVKVITSLATIKARNINIKQKMSPMPLALLVNGLQ